MRLPGPRREISKAQSTAFATEVLTFANFARVSQLPSISTRADEPSVASRNRTISSIGLHSRQVGPDTCQTDQNHRRNTRFSTQLDFYSILAIPVALVDFHRVHRPGFTRNSTKQIGGAVHLSSQLARLPLHCHHPAQSVYFVRLRVRLYCVFRLTLRVNSSWVQYFAHSAKGSVISP